MVNVEDVKPIKASQEYRTVNQFIQWLIWKILDLSKQVRNTEEEINLYNG